MQYVKKRAVLQDKPKVIVIVGPTAVGKSALAVRLARRFRGEIISADSRQVYRGLTVGTGKITEKEMREVPHHLLDVVSPKRQFSVALYQELARKKILEIYARGKLPIICGGTGLYVDTLLGRTAIPDVPPNFSLRRRLGEKTTAQLFALLIHLDPKRAKDIDLKNPRRLIRAIEIANAKRNKNPDPRRSPRREGKAVGIFVSRSVCWIGLTLPLKKLKEKIETRLFARMKGMINEVRRLHKAGLSWKRCEELGLEYRFVSRYLRGLMTKAEMLEKLRTEIGRYAKRQMQWFKRNKEIRWFNPSQKTKIYAMLKKKGL